MMDVFDLIILVAVAVFIVKVILKYFEIKKEMKESDNQSGDRDAQG